MKYLATKSVLYRDGDRKLALRAGQIYDLHQAPSAKSLRWFLVRVPDDAAPEPERIAPPPAEPDFQVAPEIEVTGEISVDDIEISSEHDLDVDAIPVPKRRGRPPKPKQNTE
jgi:hypothetical protein